MRQRLLGRCHAHAGIDLSLKIQIDLGVQRAEGIGGEDQ